MQHTLRDLFDNLEITLTELSRRSGISDVTLISIRNGKSARRSTINTLLRVFSEIYGMKLTLKNVEGIIIQGKPVNVSPAIAKQVPVQPVSIASVDDSTQIEESQNRNIELSEGTMLLKDFAEISGIPSRTLHNWLNAGHINPTHRDRPGGGGIEYLISPEDQEKARQIRHANKVAPRHRVQTHVCTSNFRELPNSYRNVTISHLRRIN